MDDRDKPRPSVILAWLRPPPPYFLGGAEISQWLLARRLAECGYEVRYIGSFEEPWPGGQVIRDKLTTDLRDRGAKLRPVGDGGVGYEWDGIKCELLPGQGVEAALRRGISEDRYPLVVSSQEGSDALLTTAREAGCATVGWIHSVSEVGMLPAEAGADYLLCVSRFVRRELRDRRGVEGVLSYPPFAPPPSPGLAPEGRRMTIINPIPAKGGELFVELARMLPETGFTAVDGWYRVELPALGNLHRFHRPAPMEDIWRDTRLLLAPSRVPEGFGRVCVEAGGRGIPTIASRRGGLPEAVGRGGMLLKSDDPRVWVRAIDEALEPTTYRELSSLAREHAARFERDIVLELRDARILV